MRIIALAITTAALAACSVSTDDEEGSLTVDVDKGEVEQLGEDAEAIATDVGRDIQEGAQRATDNVQAEISQEANEAEAESEGEAHDDASGDHSGHDH